MKSPRLLWWTPRLPHPHLPFIPWRADAAAGEFMQHVPHNILPSYLFLNYYYHSNFLNLKKKYFYFLKIIPWFLRSARLPGCTSIFFLCPVTQRDLPPEAGMWFHGYTTGTHLGQWQDFLQAHTSWLCLFSEPGRSCAKLQIHLLCPAWEWLHWKLHRAGDECWPDLISSGLAPCEIHFDQLGALVLRTRWPKRQLFAMYQQLSAFLF